MPIMDRIKISGFGDPQRDNNFYYLANPNTGATIGGHGGINSYCPGYGIHAIDILGNPATCDEVWQQGYGLAVDLDQNCRVYWSDFSIFASQWLATDCGNPADFDNSCCSGGKVDWGDFSIFAGTWLDCNDPENIPPCIANW